ncbi:MAG: N-acetylmuramoyl-L-alanine amidase [Clostridia bacterium]|nr:N-acetylmuramoyl-L-alanine amidase [Clostridia bacterium]
MKKILTLVLAAVIAATAVGPVNAASSFSQKTTQAKKINIIINGQRLSGGREPIIVNGRTLVPARATLTKLGAKLDWYPKSGNIKITKGNTRVGMTIGNNYYSVNGKSKLMDVAPVLLNGTVMVPIMFVGEALNCEVRWDGTNRSVLLVNSYKETKVSRGEKERDFIVVIDAGHGGKETGALYGGIAEKDLNLDMALRLNKLLKDEGIRTYMTRDDDTTLSLYARSALANNVNADLLVSIHNNAGHSKTTGSMTLYYPSSDKSKGKLTPWRFATIVQNELTEGLNVNDLGIISRPNLAVLRTANMPAVIAEVGYMTNKGELEKLSAPSYRQKSAEALKEAILTALKEI